MPSSDVTLLIDIDGDVQERGNPREPADIADEEGIVEEPVEEKKGLMMNERPTGIMARGGM